jgi:multidrug efflux system outer membrane protein
MKRRLLYNILLILLFSGFVSCGISKKYATPETSSADLFRDVPITDTTGIGTISYNQIFTDTILQNLIRKGLAENLDLQIAYTRVRQSEAHYRQSRAAYLPTLNANAGVAQNRLAEAQGFGVNTSVTQYELGVSSSWELDIWGKLTSSKRAALANMLATDAGARALKTRIVSNVASYYYQLVALDQQLEITEQTVRNWDSTVTTMRALKEAARVTEAAVVQSEAQRYAAEVTIPDLKQSIRETENALSVLLGIAPTSIRRGSLKDQSFSVLVKTGVPSQLLANRPDIQQAEFNYRNAFELTNVARASFYPSLTITGSAGFTPRSLSSLIDPSSFVASIGAGILQPIFNRRLNRTNLAVAREEQQAAYLSFKNSLLIAGQEVSDALSLHETAEAKKTVRENQIIALTKSVDYTRELLRNGFANYNEVILARQSLLAAELGRVNDQLQQLQAIVNLYRSLGGGWK